MPGSSRSTAPASTRSAKRFFATTPGRERLLSFVVRMAREPLRGAPRSVANLEFIAQGTRSTTSGRRSLRASRRAAIARSILDGLSHGDRSDALLRALDRLAQVPRGGGQARAHDQSPQCHPSQIPLLRSLGHRARRPRGRRLRSPTRVQPVPRMQALRRCLSVGAMARTALSISRSCFTHNYREFFGGFSDWVEQIADARDAFDYRRRISESETASMWQSLSYGANYKSAYCMAVCPAGEDVIGPYLHDKQRHLKEVVRPLQERAEPVYVVSGSDAEAVARHKFKNKTVKPVSAGLRPRSVGGLLDLHAVRLPAEPIQRSRRCLPFQVHRHGGTRGNDHHQKPHPSTSSMACSARPNLRVTADAKTWLGFLAREKSLPLALLRRKIRIKGDPQPAHRLRQVLSVSGRPSQARRGRASAIDAEARVRRAT